METQPEHSLEELVTDENIRRWRSTYGDRAERWLSTLPSIVSEYAEAWELEIDAPLEGGTASVVIGATRDEEQTVLKIHPPWTPIAVANCQKAPIIEAAAFKAWGGEGAPRLLANDERALLLEKITPARHSPNMTARDIAALITQITRPLDRSSVAIPPLYSELSSRYYRAWASVHPEISDATFNSAYRVGQMISVTADWSLVHGDLKVKNVLQREDGSFAVIDPSPAAGSPLYDAATWSIDKPEGIGDRCKEVAEYLKVDPQRIGKWMLVLLVPEICLASPARAEKTLEHLKEMIGTSDLDDFFTHDLLYSKYVI